MRLPRMRLAACMHEGEIQVRAFPRCARDKFLTLVSGRRRGCQPDEGTLADPRARPDRASASSLRSWPTIVVSFAAGGGAASTAEACIPS